MQEEETKGCLIEADEEGGSTVFFCQVGSHTTQPGEKQVKIVVETRSKEYVQKFIERDEWGKKREFTRATGFGTEIVREVNACSEHAKTIEVQEG